MSSPAPSPPKRIWNPFRPDAAYWQGKHGRLRRYFSYSFLGHVGLLLMLVLPAFIPGCKKSYDLVKGSGKPKAMIKQMKVQVKKVQRKRVLVNPNSSVRKFIMFANPFTNIF